MIIKKTFALLLALILLAGIFPFESFAENETRLRILYTGDIHSNFEKAGRLKTLIDQLSDENTIYLDSGDYAMGTLLQAGFSTDAYELRLLGKLGCDVVTVGNHEWDYGGFGFADHLNTAVKYAAEGEALPRYVQSNLDFSGELTDEQAAVKNALDNYGSADYTILNVNGKKIAVFGVLGLEAIDDSPTSGMKFSGYIDRSAAIVKELKEKEDPDCIICLSHSGTAGDGKTGEDFDLINIVSGIDVVISGHSHTAYPEVIQTNGSLLVSSGANMDYLGKLDISLGNDGITLIESELIPIDDSLEPDPEIDELLREFNDHISETYLSEYNVSPDQVIARSPISFMPLDEMYSVHQEYPLGNLIADSYLYEAERNGITDIDVAAVGLGTIRGSFSEGDITVADAFEICSLGVGSDGSAGHPILAGYITGKELKLLCELDASLGPLVSSIKMSYSGLKMKFNEKRVLLDQTTDIVLVRKDGTEEKIDDDKLYCIAANTYAANMLGMVNDLTVGILKIVIKDKDGNPVDDLYQLALKDKNDKEIKEWAAFMNYLKSFDEVNGVPEIPEELYGEPLGRKVKISKGGLAVISDPGTSTFLLGGLIILLIAIIVLLIILIKKLVRAISLHRQKKKKAE
ncbi:MAG: 5'-nucleotidase C-terminal domain-containing protein [Eubacteriales bacterium]|nr:5'-nucleotidase C-terminal domain-containing protein [Eubacteriales bacterium]